MRRNSLTSFCEARSSHAPKMGIMRYNPTYLGHCHWPCEGGHIDSGVVGGGNVVQIYEVQHRQHDRPENEGHHDAPDTFPVELAHAAAYGEQQDSGHHDEQRYTTSHRASRSTPLQESAAVCIKARHKRVATMCKHDQKTGDNAQQVYPTYGFFSSQFHLWPSVLYGNIK